MKKFLAGVVVGFIGTFGALLVEAEKRYGPLKRITAKALRMYADRLDPKWEHDYADYVDYAANYSVAAIEYPSEEMAKNVLDELRDKLKKDSFVLAADYMKDSNQTPEHVDYNWGWTDLSKAYVYCYKTKGVIYWAIHLPKPMRVEHIN